MELIDVSADHYVLICARQYVQTMRRLRSAANDDERRHHTKMLLYLMDGGIIEAELQYQITKRRLPADIKDHIDKKEVLQVSRIISREEAELIRQVYSVPPVATFDGLARPAVGMQMAHQRLVVLGAELDF
jgi:hypothetical protein